MFCDFENRLKISLAKSHHKYSKLNESMLKRFFLLFLFYSIKKKFMVLKFCMGARDLTADGKLIKQIKKSMKEKKLMSRIEPRP
jgi:hypothetical protein